MDCSTPGLPIHQQLLELTQTNVHVHWVSDAIQPSHPLVLFSTCLHSFPAFGSLPVSQLFLSGGQSIGVSATASVLPMNTQDWFPLGWTGWTSFHFTSVQFSSVTQSCQNLCDPMNRSTPGLPIRHHLPEFTQTHVHWVNDASQPSHPLLSPSPPAFSLSQPQGLFQWVSSSH